MTSSTQKLPLISVVVPVYNRADIVARCLLSAASQHYRPLEIVVVDDGSVDGTGDRVREWANEFATQSNLSCSLICQENKGANSARNAGIKAATGQFIAFLDSDDTWHPDKLQRQVAVLLNDDRIGGVYCGMQNIDLDTGLIELPFHALTHLAIS